MADTKPRYSMSERRMTRCLSDDDGDCTSRRCPQLRDGEPAKSGRHCPLDSKGTSTNEGSNHGS